MVDRVLPIRPQETLRLVGHLAFGVLERLVRFRHRLLPEQACEIVPHRVRQDEIAVGQPLHQRRGAEAVRAVVGEVRLAAHEASGDGAHQVIVHPEPAHGVVRRRVDAHRSPVRVLAGDAVVHLEQVAVPLLYLRAPQPPNRLGKVEEHAVFQRPDAPPAVHLSLRGARCDITWDEVAEGGVLALQVVVAVGLRDLVGRPRVVRVLRHPDAAVIAQRL